MKNIIDQEQRTIEGIWEFPLYIPIYQREFVWEDEQIENAARTIFEDKENEMESYMGNILLVEKNEEGVKFREIVDGQQRMTFSFIFIKSIYEITKEIKDKLPSDDENLVDFNEDVISHIMTNSKNLLVVKKNERLSDNHMPRIAYASGKLNDNITSQLYGVIDGVPKPDGRTAISKMQKKLKNLIYSTISTNEPSMKDYKLNGTVEELKRIAREIKSLFEYITKHIKYIEIKLTEEKYATEIFERMNSTSKPLTDYELFKNYIAGQLINSNQKNVDSKITELDDLVNDTSAKLDTTSIIRSLLYLKQGRVTSSKYKFDKLKNEYASKRNPKQMFKEVKNLLETYSNLEKLSIENKCEKILLPYLIIKTYNLKQLRPAIIAMFIEFGCTDKLVELFMLLISIIFKNIVFNGDVANTIESLLYQTFSENGKLLEPEKIIEKIKSKDIYERAKEMNIDQRTFDSIRKNEFTKVMWIYSINREFGNINSLTNSSTSDITINFSGTQVEHILPRSWEENWSHIMNKIDEFEWPSVIDNPGNKIPILGEYNIKASNKSFSDKKKNHYVKSSLNSLKQKEVNEPNKWVISTGVHFDIIEKADAWTKKEIEERSSLLREDFIKNIEEWF